MEYLDEIVPQPPILPKDALGRARVREIAFVIACDIHPVNNLRLGQYLKRELGASDEQQAAGSATGSRSALRRWKKC